MQNVFKKFYCNKVRQIKGNFTVNYFERIEDVMALTWVEKLTYQRTIFKI